MPSFIVKNGPEKPPQNVAVFAVFLVSSFSISLSFSPCFSLFPVVSCYLGIPKTAHQVRLQAHIYIYAVKLLTGSSLALFKVINWSKSKLLTVQGQFRTIK